MRPHGVLSRYTHGGCRCDECRKAQREYARKWVARNREKHNTYVREWANRRYHERRAAALERLGGECVECGETDKLHFDHIDPDSKEAAFDHLFHWGSEERLEQELGKAQLLCASCHAYKTFWEDRCEAG